MVDGMIHLLLWDLLLASVWVDNNTAEGMTQSLLWGSLVAL